MEECDLKIILLGDSAVGKSKLMERFLLQDYKPAPLSTYALTMYRYKTIVPGSEKEVKIDFWDTAGQERFESIHPSYYIVAHACILVFDATRKVTYQNLEKWYSELVQHKGISIPILVAANKVDMDPEISKKSFGFVSRKKAERGQDVPFYCVSASNGVNVVALFQDSIKHALDYKAKGGDTFVDQVLEFIKEEEKRPDGLFSTKSDNI